MSGKRGWCRFAAVTAFPSGLHMLTPHNSTRGSVTSSRQCFNPLYLWRHSQILWLLFLAQQHVIACQHRSEPSDTYCRAHGEHGQSRVQICCEWLMKPALIAGKK